MANVDSISFALLIPFAVCFALVFLVCCFADEIKEICRLPSPLPRNYIAVDSGRDRRRRHNSRRVRTDDGANLIASEEGRSRNVSESSVESNVNVQNYHNRLLRTHLPSIMIQQGFILCPQTELTHDQNRPIVNQASLHSVLLPGTSTSSPMASQVPAAAGKGPIIVSPDNSGAVGVTLGAGSKKQNSLNSSCVIVNKDNSHLLTTAVTLISKSGPSPTNNDRQ